MASNEKRFGISLLSKSKNNDAYLEEVMIDKLTGDVAIKTPKGDIISFGYNAKLNNHMVSARNDANEHGVYGNVYNIPFKNRILPLSMSSETANLYESVYVRKSGMKGFMIHADIDSVSINVDEFSMNRYFGVATFGIKVHYSDTTISNVMLCNVNTRVMNDTVFDLTSTDDFSNLDTTKTISGIELTQFDITSNTDSAGVSANNIEVRHIINSLFIITKE